METSSLAISDFERVMAELFRPVEAEWPQFADSDFDTMSRLLADVGKPQWSYRPRTYAVLRIIDRVDLFDEFTLEGLKDIAFPYSDSRLPNSLSPTVKAKFLQAQKLVLTKASDLEKTDGRHRHLDEDADAHFHILKILGRGAFGEVHRVRSKLSLEKYARKRVHRRKAFSKDKAAIEMFENELTNLKRLSHHHLVEFVGSYTDPKYIGLLMSPVADCDLKFFLERSPFPKDDLHLLRGFFGCLCSAVLYLHNSKCRHKDLKPGNILVYMNNVLITDFGTARDWSEQSRSTTSGRSGPYTPGYAAPEVVNEDPRNSSADIWPLGCVYLDMMTVLQGETLASKDQFFAKNGTGGANPRSNTKAFESWLTRLNQETDNEPIKWITKMIKRAPNERITAAGLIEQIYLCEDGHVYYNSCCNGEEESEDGTSYHGSILDDDATSVKHSQNSAKAWVENDVVKMTASTSNHSLNKDIMLRQAPPLSPSKSDNRMEPEAIFQDLDAVSKRTNTYSLTTKLLLDNGFDIHAYNFKVEDALIWAVKSGHEAAVELLLEKEADVETKDNEGKTVLHWAAWHGREAIVQLLLEKGADIGAKSNSGWTALYRAADCGSVVVVQLLLDKGADVETKDNEGKTVLHWAAWHGREAIVQLLLEKGADTKTKSNNGRTALHRAAWKGHKAVVQMLLGKGADFEARDNDGYTALHLAAEEGSKAVVQLLLKKRADFEVKSNNGRTALHRAACKGHTEVVQLLLDKGADIETKCNNGMRALHMAARDGHEAVVQLLLKEGAHNGARDIAGKTALYYAENGGHRMIVNLLKKVMRVRFENSQDSLLGNFC